MATRARRVEDYRDLAYGIAVMRADAGADGEPRWTAQVDELAGCEAGGGSPEEAVARLQDAMADWIAEALAAGRPVPEPRAELSGRLLVRMPRTLHAELARAAGREQVSLNQFITGVLSAAVDWRRSPAPTATAEPRPAPPSRLLQLALLANLALVAAAAIVAVVLLVSGG
jgi:predicted HicB family RNase H-like nuclease